MLFYKVTGMLPEKDVEREEDDRVKRKKAIRILRMSDEFNEQRKEEAYCFVSDINDHSVICGVAAFRSGDILQTIHSFLEAIDQPASKIIEQEITLTAWSSLLKDAHDYIGFDIEILESLKINFIHSRRPGFELREYLIDERSTVTGAYEKAETLMSRDTLVPELDRIMQGCNGENYGHPVHYMIEADTLDTRKGYVCALLIALYEKRRVKSRRYCCVDIDPYRTLGCSYDEFYKSCSGGTVVVNCPGTNSEEEDDHADSVFETIEALTRTMRKYRHQVLTVFCLPREGEKIKKLLFEKLGTVSVVEIREDLADRVRAEDYLKEMCRRERVEPDTELLETLESEKQYLPDELQEIFDEWYNRKLKTVVFPQYRELAGCRSTALKEPVKGNAYDELNEMIGLISAKNVIKKALNYYKLQRIYKDKGLKQDRPAMHMVFTGNPGTAKTTVARLFARIMKENGLLSKGHLVEVGRGDLIARYVGWTAKTVQEKFKKAVGGVLFIDEAYSLVDDRGGSFGDEAINTIVQEMENRREDLIVIFAGYSDKMDGFLNKNPGLRSRIAFHVPFEDYSAEELCDIANLIGKTKGINLSNSAVVKLSVIFEEARKQKDFGNGRYVRNIIELSQMNQAERILAMDPDEVTQNNLVLIEAEDIEVPMISRKVWPRSIGFAL